MIVLWAAGNVLQLCAAPCVNVFNLIDVKHALRLLWKKGKSKIKGCLPKVFLHTDA